MLGKFWAKGSLEEGLDVSVKKEMSEQPSRPTLTPQFCFNQRALRGMNTIARKV